MPTVLIVDDHAPSRQFLATLLSYSGYRIVEASDGINALDCAESERPDLVISDIQMPRMDGREFANRLRQDTALASVPVIFYTATFRESDARAIAGSCGVDIVLTKPAEPEVLLKVVEDALHGMAPLIPAPALSEHFLSMNAASFQLSAVVELGIAMSRERSIARLLDLFCKGIRCIVDAEWVVAGLSDSGESKSLPIVSLSCLDSARSTCDAAHRFLTDCVRDRRAMKTDEEFRRRATELPALKAASSSMLAFPIASNERLSGWVYVGDKHHANAFTQEDEHLVDALIGQLTVAYDNLLFAGEQRRLEQELRQAHKVEAVGRLAGGVAHDFNNLLTIILGYSNMALPLQPPDSPMFHTLTEIKKAGERAAALTKQLLAFSRREAIYPIVLNPNSIVTGAEKMLRRLIGEDIDIHVELAADAGRVKMDPGQLEQILLNLVVNAREAMPCGGRVDIQTQRRRDEVVLTVRDSGCGMSPETLEHILEPYYTTKPFGTGVGLSTVQEIIRSAKGRLEVESELGVGSTFRVVLPATAAPEIALVLESGSKSEGDETILLVEDEDLVRSLVTQVLEQHGYRVLAANSGIDAKRICLEHHGPIHLLLTDVVMPHMSGPLLWAAVAGCRPEMNVLFMSGYLDDAVTRHGVGRTEALIQKPFMPDSLCRKVRETLNVVPAMAAAQ